MSKKVSKGGSVKGNKKKTDDDREDALQAVVLTDSFETRFNPFTLERPRCLLPLANTPLIEYTLEFLANAGVEDIFIYCGAHTDQVERYIRNSKWSQPSSPFSKLEIIKSTSRSIGDAMRDLDARDVIAGDFLIVSGDVISNLPLESALAKHRSRRQEDKNAIMTMILRESGLHHRTQSQGVTPVFVLDPSKERCLHYEEMHPQQDSRYVKIDPDVLASCGEIDVRNDLLDCYIDICTPDVLALWTDSFDYESPRKHFLFGVLKDHELNGKTIHTHIINDHYAARVRNLQAYDAVSKDIVSRWSYPLCPDSNLLPGQSYRFQRGNIYKEEGVVLARSSVVKRRSVIGQRTNIGDGSIISNSVIGRGCQIGKNVTIEGAYIWDDAVIGDGTIVRQAIIADGASIGSNCFIEPGALLSFGVKVANGTIVPGRCRITRCGKDASSMDDEAIVGEGGKGHNMADEDEEDEDERAESLASSGLVYNLSALAVSSSSISTLDSSSPYSPVHHPTSSFATQRSDMSNEDDFHLDAASSIFDALQRGEGSDIVQIELQGLRMGEDADYHRVRRAIIAAFMQRINILIDSQSLAISTAVAQVLRNYTVVFNKTIFDKDNAVKVDQVDFLLSLQSDLARRIRGESLLFCTIKELYEMDVLEEDGILQWWQDERGAAVAAAGGEMTKVRGMTRKFVEWLETAEEDSD